MCALKRTRLLVTGSRTLREIELLMERDSWRPPDDRRRRMRRQSKEILPWVLPPTWEAPISLLGAPTGGSEPDLLYYRGRMSAASKAGYEVKVIISQEFSDRMEIVSLSPLEISYLAEAQGAFSINQYFSNLPRSPGETPAYNVDVIDDLGPPSLSREDLTLVTSRSTPSQLSTLKKVGLRPVRQGGSEWKCDIPLDRTKHAGTEGIGKAIFQLPGEAIRALRATKGGTFFWFTQHIYEIDGPWPNSVWVSPEAISQLATAGSGFGVRSIPYRD